MNKKLKTFIENRKKTILIIAIILLIVLLSGGTYAFWLWRGSVGNVSYTGELPFNCAADGGTHASTVALAPAACTHSRLAVQREITVNHDLISPDTSVYMDMTLTVKQIGSGLSASSNFKYALTTSPTSCTTGVVASGTFTNKTAGTTINLFTNRPYNYTGGSLTTNKFYLYIWIDPTEENPNVLNQTFSCSLDLLCTQGEKTDSGSDSGGSSNATGAAMLINKANPASVTTYSSGTTTEMYTFSQPATTQLAATTDYRYIGSSPNNYITFNDETWRIIGVFDNKIKIIKDTSIGDISLDYKQSGIGSSTSDYGSNDWVDSQLMYMLNPNDIAANVALKTDYTHDDTYVYDANSKIIYQKGCNPSSTDGSTYSCTANTWSLNATALSQVADVTYYLGGSSANSGLSAVDYYTFERGETKYDAVRSTNWTGKVGLMYPSDYAYTFAYGVDDTCYSSTSTCNNSTPSSSWLFNSSHQWTLSPLSGSANYVVGVYSTGYVYYYGPAGITFGVRPVVYLKSDIVLSGNGTNDANIYTIVS